MRLNGAMLEDYSKAEDGVEVARIQNEYIRSAVGGPNSDRRGPGGMFRGHTRRIEVRSSSEAIPGFDIFNTGSGYESA
jgi:hypothetical protein